jgi:hypothetical protein
MKEHFSINEMNMFSCIMSFAKEFCLLITFFSTFKVYLKILLKKSRQQGAGIT